LPKKFGIDKRYAHLSNLINAGQLSREEAVKELENPPYPEKLQKQDLEYVTKKLGISLDEFEKIMNEPPKTFRSYENSYDFVQFLKKLVNWMRKLGIYPR
jgi:hypothetical protein